MSGHSKWAQIKHKKAVVDEKRGKVFSTLGALITLASRKLGPNPDTNLQLRRMIEKARAVNMPKENIERAIHGGPDTDATAFREVWYEAFGPGGAALLIRGVTDNNNRTLAEVRTVLNSHGGKMTPGGTAWMFIRNDSGWHAQTQLPIPDEGAQRELALLIEALEECEDVQKVYTNAQES